MLERDANGEAVGEVVGEVARADGEHSGHALVSSFRGGDLGGHRRCDLVVSVERRLGRANCDNTRHLSLARRDLGALRSVHARAPELGRLEEEEDERGEEAAEHGGAPAPRRVLLLRVLGGNHVARLDEDEEHGAAHQRALGGGFQMSTMGGRRSCRSFSGGGWLVASDGPTYRGETGQGALGQSGDVSGNNAHAEEGDAAQGRKVDNERRKDDEGPPVFIVVVIVVVLGQGVVRLDVLAVGRAEVMRRVLELGWI